MRDSERTFRRLFRPMGRSRRWSAEIVVVLGVLALASVSVAPAVGAATTAPATAAAHAPVGSFSSRARPVYTWQSCVGQISPRSAVWCSA